MAKKFKFCDKKKWQVGFKSVVSFKVVSVFVSVITCNIVMFLLETVTVLNTY